MTVYVLSLCEIEHREVIGVYTCPFNAAHVADTRPLEYGTPDTQAEWERYSWRGDMRRDADTDHNNWYTIEAHELQGAPRNG